ncbi:MAG: hypothetical protein HY718_19175 [Planctomycetes bacterium]|nr:hypothetical protein [Planctomycetota bacterium]
MKRVEPAGIIHLHDLPLPAGQMVEVILLPVDDSMTDLAEASESALGFWNNDIDDRVWNDALSSTDHQNGDAASL